jgi:glycosyltransferase involved in cell wall biosynthesis
VSPERSLNVLHLSQTDAGGGSARSARRIHEGLGELGYDTRMLVGEKRTDDPLVRSIKRNLAWRAADRASAEVLDRLSLQYLFYPSSFGVALDPWFRSADVVQLYNTHGSYFSHTALPLLSRRKPVVWRLSDMWPVTGHVAYSYDCDRWRFGCGACPYLAEYPSLRRDRTALLWRVKQAAYARSRLTIVAPSSWTEQIARASPLLSRFDVRRIPNGVDLTRFRPHDKQAARAALGLDVTRKTVLFSSLDLADRRKGSAYLVAALAHLQDLDLQLVTIGGGEAPEGAVALGVITDDDKLALAYAAADVFALPTIAENLPNTAIESLACGTPCAAFATGGVPDAVRHLDTGSLAPTGNAEALAGALRLLLEDDGLRERLGANARAVAEAEYSSELQARRFADLYEELVARE